VHKPGVTEIYYLPASQNCGPKRNRKRFRMCALPMENSSSDPWKCRVSLSVDRHSSCWSCRLHCSIFWVSKTRI